MRRPLLPYILLGIGCLLFLIAMGSAIQTGMYLSHAAHVTGMISDQSLVRQPVTGQRDQVTFRPTITFQTADGHWMAVTSKVSTRSAHISGGQWVNTTPQVHDRVPVVYDPANPADARIDSFMSVWIVPFVFCVLGTAFLLFGFVFSFLAQRA